MAPDKNFKVLIAGGGIAGIAFANFLERLGIDYVLLEGYKAMAPQVGASIGIAPNGFRVLDQVGLYEPIRKCIDRPLSEVAIYTPEGKLAMKAEDCGNNMTKRYGYDLIFVDRQMVVQAMWDNVRNKNNIHLNKRVQTVSLKPDGVEVTTTDGSKFEGDILVGADGVHSQVRSEMWRLADQMEPGYLPASEHTKSLPTMYKCIFGISIMKEWPKDRFQVNCGHGYSYLIVSGPKNRIYWFLFYNIGKTHYLPDLPTYTKEDEAELVKKHLGDKVSENFTFGDLYGNKISSVLTPLPEYVFKKWHFNRIMTIGDAAHKMEPIGGMGGNTAIETAAVLASNLATLLKTHPAGVSTEDIHNMFAATQARRHDRAQYIVDNSHMLQVFAAFEKPGVEFAVRNILPLASLDWAGETGRDTIVNGDRIDVLEVPKRPRLVPYTDEIPFSRIQGPLPIFAKFVTGALLVALFILGLKFLEMDGSAFSSPDATFVGYPLKSKFVGVPGVDELLRLIVAAFSEAIAGADMNLRVLAFYFLANIGSIGYIWNVEAHRICNSLSPVALVTIFGIAYQLFGIAMVAPIYFLISLYTTSSAAYTRSEGRKVKAHHARALLPALATGFVVPTALMFANHLDHWAKQDAIAFWQPFPIYVSALTWFFSRVAKAVAPPKSKNDELWSTDDIAPIMTGYQFCFFSLAAVHLSTVLYALRAGSGAISILETLFGTPAAGMAAFWKYDFLLCFAAVGVWCLYSIFELRRLGYVSTDSARKAVGLTLLGQVAVGPGATYAALWAWRENVYAGLAIN